MDAMAKAGTAMNRKLTAKNATTTARMAKPATAAAIARQPESLMARIWTGGSDRWGMAVNRANICFCYGVQVPQNVLAATRLGFRLQGTPVWRYRPIILLVRGAV